MKLKDIILPATQNDFKGVAYIGDTSYDTVYGLETFFSSRPYLLDFELIRIPESVGDYNFYVARHQDWHASYISDGSKHWMYLNDIVFITSLKNNNRLVAFSEEVYNVHTILSVESRIRECPDLRDLILVIGASNVISFPKTDLDNFVNGSRVVFDDNFLEEEEVKNAKLLPYITLSNT